MRDFDEFMKIAKKQKYNQEDYPYGYRRGRGSVTGKTLKSMGAGAALGGTIAPILLAPFSRSGKSALIKSAIGAGIGAYGGFELGRSDAKDNRDLSWASSETQKKLLKAKNNITHKAYDLDDSIHPMYERAFNKTPEAKAIRKELASKGLSQKEIENSHVFHTAFTNFVDNSYNKQDALFQRMTKANDKLEEEDNRTRMAYDAARKQAIIEGRNNRLNFKKHAELDEMYFAKVAADAPDIESEKDIIPKLTQEVTFVVPEKTPPTPGGKMTPSKYVQRKNKERYQG